MGSVQFSRSVMSDSLQPHGLQHTSPSPTPRAYSNSCSLSQWCHPTISSSVVPFSSFLQSFPASVSSSESVLRIRWPKYWSFSFSINPAKEYSGMISFRVEWFDLLLSKRLSRVFFTHYSLKASIVWHSAFYMLQHLYVTTEKTITLIIQTFVRKVMPLFLICCISLS